MKHEERLKLWDEWIREGHASRVRTLCRRFNHAKIPRSYLVDYAQIARRVGAPDLIVLWLRHIVRAEKPLALKPSAKEKAIYGLGLMRLGAFREACQIFADVEPEDDPQIYFYRASLNMNQWNYARAISDLRKYSRHKDIPAYSRLVGRLNLCAALVSSGKKQAANVEIEKLLRILKRKKILLLQGNLLEIRSQLFCEERRFEEALKDLDDASRILSHADARSLLYVEKWRLIIKLKADPDDRIALTRFETLKSTAIAIKDWETVRDSDLHKALALKDRNLILSVYWGSKFKAYKKRILTQFGDLTIEPAYDWTNEPSRNTPIVDLVAKAPTKSLRKLFYILTREMYQPLRATEIIDTLYPDEYYHSIASPAKLHRLIARARNWLVASAFPVSIDSYRNAFRLRLTGPCRLRLLAEPPSKPTPPMPAVTEREFFTTKEWAREKGVSERTARREILALTATGMIEGVKRGPRTKYRAARRY